MEREDILDDTHHADETPQPKDYVIMVHEVVHFWGRVRVQANNYEEAAELARNDFVADWADSDTEETREELIDVQEAK